MEPSLKKCSMIVIETNTENPVTVAMIENNEIYVADDYRIRLQPKTNLLEELKASFEEHLRHLGD